MCKISQVKNKINKQKLCLENVYENQCGVRK